MRVFGRSSLSNGSSVREYTRGGQIMSFSKRMACSARTRSMGVIGRPRGLQDSFFKGSSPYIFSQHAYGPVIRQEPFGGEDDCRVSRQEGHTGGRYRYSGILFPPVLCAEKERRVETYPQPETTERLCGSSFHENGNGSVGQNFTSGWRVGGVHRFEGRLPTCPCSRGLLEVPALPIRRQSLRVSSPAVRTGDEPLCLYSCGQGGGRAGAPYGHQDAYLSRRLVDSRVVKADMSHQCTVGDRLDSPVGISSQLGEIRVGALPSLHVLGSGLRSGGGICATHTGSSPQLSNVSSTFDRTAQYYGTDATRGVGTHGIAGLSQCEVPAVQTTDTMASRPPVGWLRLGYGSDLGNLVHETDPRLFERQVFLTGRSITPTGSGYGSVHRRVFGRLRGTSVGFTVVRGMESLREATSYQSIGDGSGSPCMPPIPKHYSPTPSFIEMRQHHGGGIPQSVGRHEVHDVGSHGSGDSRVMRFPGSDVVGEAHTVFSERPRRCPESTLTRADGVDVEQDGGCQGYPVMGQSTGGHVRNQIEPPIASVCVTSTRHVGVGVRRIEHGLDGTGSVCLPSSITTQQSTSHVRTATVSGDTDSPRVGGATLVSATSGASDTGAGAAARDSGSAQSTIEADGVAQETRSLPTSRVEVVESSLRGRGFSKRIAKLVSTAKRQSTEAVYQSHWRDWVGWATTRDFDPLSPTVNDLAEYFLSLVQERKLKVQTVKGHRSSIFTTLRQCGRRDFSNNLVLHDLLKSLQSTVQRPSILPKWNVFLVLHALKGLPYEPLRFASLRALTWKTLFLVSLAACRRVSEIHAFLHDLVDYNTDGSVTLWTDPVFVAKTQGPGEEFPPTTILSLSRTLSADNSDRLLCPVRALKYYLERTKLRRRKTKRLFISFTNQSGDITKNALSRWMAATIKLAYEMAGDHVLQNFSVRPHEIRAISASLNFHDSMDIFKVLNAGIGKVDTRLTVSIFETWRLGQMAHAGFNL